MRLIVSSDAHEIGIRHPSAAVISNIVYLETSPQWIVTEGEKAVSDARESYNQRLREPEVRGFRELFANLRYPQVEPAGERLVRTFIDRGFKSINALVDAYNIEAVAAMCGLGMHDSSASRSDCRIYRAKGTEDIVPIFKNKPKRINEGDLIYSRNSSVLAWLGARDVDSNVFRITESVKDIILIALGNQYTGESYNRNILERCFKRMQTFSPDAEIEFLKTTFE